MENRLVYTFSRDHHYGYDKIQIVAFSDDQAKDILNNTVKEPGEWQKIIKLKPQPVGSRIAGYECKRCGHQQRSGAPCEECSFYSLEPVYF